MSSGVAWIDRKVAELRGSRDYLATIGMAPSPVADGVGQFYRGAEGSGWRVPHWAGIFSDDALIEFAKARGFRVEAGHG